MSGVRFAPSPTGSFHVGNFRTAWISHHLARAYALPWVVRFEDIDVPRVVEGARERQLREMRELGLVPDELSLQSERAARHLSLFERAAREGRVYPCSCSRREIQEALAGVASAPHSAQPVYNGRCRPTERGGPSPWGSGERERGFPTIAWRFRGDPADGSQDFIVARTGARSEDFVPSYHWACAIDDRDGRYELLVRAWDLESVIDQHRAIHRLIDEWEGVVPLPAVFHASLVVQDSGTRLEKRTRGVTLPELHGAGITSSQLSTTFERSFVLPPRPAPGAISGERERTRTLVSLGLAISFRD
jgi:glutamyl-tRNA synthetase